MASLARSARVRAARIAAAIGFAVMPLSYGHATDAPVAASADHPYAQHVTEASQRFGIPETWIWRVMQAESRGRPRIISRAGAMGLMQIMPRTWTMLSARHRLGSDPFDVRANILAGAAYLRAMWDRYGDARLMFAAYNAGPGRVDDYTAGRRGLPSETIAYVAQVAPSLGASGNAPLAPAPTSEPRNWRQASLFASPPEHSASATASTIDAQPERAPAAPIVDVLRTVSVLFVPLSGQNP